MSRRGRAVSADGTPKNPPAPAEAVPLSEGELERRAHQAPRDPRRELRRDKHRCGLCGRKLVHAEDAYGPGDPRIDCGGDCLACMWSVEVEAGEHRARRPDEFQLGMDDDRVWVGMDDDPRPLFALSPPEAALLVGKHGRRVLATMTPEERQEATLLEERIRDWMDAADKGKIDG